MTYILLALSLIFSYHNSWSMVQILLLFAIISELMSIRTIMEGENSDKRVLGNYYREAFKRWKDK